MAGETPSGFRFLYRNEQGRIDRARWLSAAAPLAIVFVVASAIMLWALPYANRPLTERAFYDPAALAANVFILAYAALTIFVGISWVNLGAKRSRDRGRSAPLGLAGLMPLAVLLAGAAHWLQPRVAEVMPRWSVWACDALLAIAAVWTFAELLDLLPKAKSR